MAKTSRMELMRAVHPSYLQDFLRVYRTIAYNIRIASGEYSSFLQADLLPGIHIHFHIFVLCTAKERIHPQFPQGYPQILADKMA